MAEKQAIFTLMGGRIRMYRGAYNPTSDAVWLASYAPRNIKTLLDVGVGTGGVGLCIASNNPGIKLTGLDISPEMLTECARNAELNNITTELINADITTWVRKCIARVRPRGYFCIIVSADRISEVIAEMHNHCGAIQIMPLFGAKHTAERVLIRGRTGVRGGDILWSGLPMNYEPILRDGLTIDDVLARLNWI